MTDIFNLDLIPPHDADRLKALEKYNILYTPAESSFDNITEMMGIVFGAPLAFVSLVDKETVFYKSQVGPFGRDRVDRKDSLCSFTILSDDILVITDAREIEALKNTPYVAPEGGIRFYAGAPLITREGYHIGTACIVDTIPRAFSEEHRELLIRFARLVMHEIEQRLVELRQTDLQLELQRAHTQLNTALKAGKVTTWHLDLTKNLIYGNADLAEMFELSAENLEEGFDGARFMEAIHEEDRQIIVQSFEHALATGKDYEAEYRIKRNGGEDTWVIARAQVVKENEVVRGLTGVVIDISDKKGIEQDVQRKNAELEGLYRELKFVTDTIPQLAWATDPDGSSYFFNKGWLQYTGSSLEENLGYGWLDFVHPEDLPGAEACWNEAVRTGGTYQTQYRLRHADGSYRWFLARGTAMKDADGAILKWYGTTTDIQDHKLAQDQLESHVEERTRELLEANTDLRQLYSELEQFAFVSHHDLREPIRKILIFAQMIKSDNYEMLPESSRVRLDKVIATAQRMNVALGDILNYATLSKKEEPAVVDINLVLSQISTELELYMAEKEAQVILTDLPTLWAVPRQIHQLFYNLISNSLKYSRPGVPPCIQINSRKLTPSEVEQNSRLATGKEYYEITVEDNGIGFEEIYADRIFTLFQRLHTRDAYAGTGIGLALVKKVVSSHGGSIWVKSAVGQGATFGIILPLMQSTSLPTEHSLPLQPAFNDRQL